MIEEMERAGEFLDNDTQDCGPIRVVLATGLYPPDIGGPATYTKMLEEHLPQMDIETQVVPFGWVRRYPKGVRHVVYAWKLYAESKGASVIYALDPVSVGLPASYIARMRKIPFMLRIAGDYAWEQGQQRFGVTETLDEFAPKTTHSNIFVSLLKRVQRAVAKRAVRIIVPSEYMKGIVSSWGIEEAKITRVYSALFPLSVSDTKDSLRKQLKYSGVVLTSAARLVPWKGMEVLIDAVKTLIDSGKEVTLVILGDGPLRGQLEKQVKDLRIEDNVRLVGRQSKDALGAAIKASDVFILNTSYEGLSHQLLEVMDLGVPIVTTAVGGNPELITDQKEGLLVQFNEQEALVEAIGRLAREGSLREHLIQNARARVKGFEKETVVAELAEVLEREIQS